jgi:phage major head subunit gpT-like protein
MQITPANLQALQTSFSTIFKAAYRDTPSFWKRIATRVSSSTKTNTYGWMQRLLAMREWVGPRVIQNMSAVSYLIENKPYEATLGVDRDEIEDDALGLFDARVQELARVGARLPDQLILEALQNGATNLGFDGVAFFSASHPLNPAGVQSNLVNLPLNPGNFAYVQAQMSTFTGEDGRPLGAYGTLLVIPPAMEFMAKQILAASTGVNGGVNTQLGAVAYLVIPELAGTNDWYLLDVSAPIKPFIFQDRKPVTLVSKTAVTDDNVFWQREFIWGIDGRGAAGYGPWWLAIKSTGGVSQIAQPPIAVLGPTNSYALGNTAP